MARTAAMRRWFAAAGSAFLPPSPLLCLFRKGGEGGTQEKRRGGDVWQGGHGQVAWERGSPAGLVGSTAETREEKCRCCLLARGEIAVLLCWATAFSSWSLPTKRPTRRSPSGAFSSAVTRAATCTTTSRTTSTLASGRVHACAETRWWYSSKQQLVRRYLRAVIWSSAH